MSQFYTRAATAPATLDPTGRTVNLLWTAGGRVIRYDDILGREYIEELPAAAADLSRLNAGAPVLADHNNELESIIGVVDRAWVEGSDGWATIRFSARDDIEGIFADVSAGIIRNVSVGYQVEQFELVNDPAESLPIYRATRWLPMEVSLVAVPADAAAQIRKLSTPTNEVKTMTDAVKTEQPAETAPVMDTAAVEKRAATEERSRIASIRAFAASSRTKPELVERLIEEGVSLATAKERMIEAWSAVVDAETSRAHVDFSVTEDETDRFRRAAIGSISARAGMATDETVNEFRGYSLMDFARRSLDMQGIKSTGLSKMDLVARAFTHTTSDFGHLLADVANKSLQKGYEDADETFQRWTTRGDLPDFKASKRVDLNAFPSLSSIAEGAEYTEATIGNRGETIQLATYGKTFSISRQAIINDDLSAFSKIPAKMGQAAIRTVGNLVYAVLTSNAAMSDSVALFHANHSNLLTGAALSTDSVSAMKAAMAKQKDGTSNSPLNIRLGYVIVPVSLEGTALVVANSEFKVGGSDNLTIPNVVRGTFEVIADARLDASSTAVWYGAANPMRHDTVEVAYLDGNDRPYIEQQNGWNVDGAQFKVRIDAGVKALDFRTLAKNPGA